VCSVARPRRPTPENARTRVKPADPSTVDPSTDFLADPSVPTDELVIPVIVPTAEDKLQVLRVANVQRIDSQEYLGGHTDEGVPTSFITLSGLRRHGWTQIPSGWLLESTRPLTSDQISAARNFAATNRLTIETRRETTSLTTPIAFRNRCRRVPRARDPRHDRGADPQ